MSPTEFEASAATVGPWGATLQHGGPPAALLGAALEAEHARPGASIAHFALEFLSPVPVARMRIATEVLRPGRKIELLAATASIDGRVALRATAWRVACGRSRSPEVGFADPVPALPAVADTRLFATAPPFGYGQSIEWRFSEGAFHTLGPATVWTRLRVAIVQGAPVSPLGRTLAMVDSANGISAELEPGTFLFVPVNLTVSVARAADGEWVGMQARTAISSEGVGTTHARLFDARGFFGEALQTLYVEQRA